MVGPAPRKSKVSYAEVSSDEDVVVQKGKKLGAKAAMVVESDEEGSDFEVQDEDNEEEDDEDEDDDDEMVIDEEEVGSDQGDSAVEGEDVESEDVIEEEAPKRKKAKPAKKSSKASADDKMKALDPSLAPLSTLPDIFKHLVEQANSKGGIDKLVDKLDGRGLRVGTMCSGTESPVLALGMISTAYKELTGKELKVDHLFSAEIEPFKQAYIERNFSPPRLFRDVTTLGADQALTAYGGWQNVPHDIDILIAGTSCVDYSGLNRMKKGLKEQGESGRTFYGMLDYVVKCQTKLVILENVSTCPWELVVKEFNKRGYSAEFYRLDTKHYYIPHTRTRGYLFATPKSMTSEQEVNGWLNQLQRLKRPASAPLEAFMLATDDPRIHRTRNTWIEEATHRDENGARSVDWIRCEGRHERARIEELLGHKRALTNWQDGGAAPTLPDGSWNFWAMCQTERVTDLIDINFLRNAKKGLDITYKSAVWNLSQNVDRENGSPLIGVAPCLTPTMIPFLLNRLGPITGRESLSLQGLPIEQLLLTRENEDQLADLAGNAMSATVVGAAMLAALLSGYKSLKEWDPEELMVVDANKVVNDTPLEDRIRGEDRLTEESVDLSKCDDLDASTLELANKTGRKCVCEGRSGVANSQISYCESCGHTTCEDHKAVPDHHYKVDPTKREDPHNFAADIKKKLPMRFSLIGFNQEALEAKAEELRQADVPLDEKVLPSFIETVSSAVDGHEVHFVGLVRRKVWVATYAADRLTLELHFEVPNQLEWRLVVHSPPELAANDPLRLALDTPVGRLVHEDITALESLVSGQWDVSLPVAAPKVYLEFQNSGTLVRSWRANLGLPEYADEQRYDHIEVSVPTETASFLDRDVAGLYELQPDCGTACQSLYKRVSIGGEAVDPSAIPLFFFLDPTRSEETEHDSFKFSHVCSRIDYGVFRPTAAIVVPKWRGNVKTDKEQVQILITNRWAPLAGASIQARPEDATTFAIPASGFQLGAEAHACSFAENLLRATVQLDTGLTESWAKPEWTEVDLVHQGNAVFDRLAWLLSRIPNWDAFETWQSVDNKSLDQHCHKCTPTPPTIKWVKNSSKNSYYAVEDGNEAARFEQALKARPTPVLIHVKQTEDNVLTFKCGYNAATLMHRAVGLLPAKSSIRSFEVSHPEVQWRLKSSDATAIMLGKSGKHVSFTLPDNKHDEPAVQPPQFTNKKAQLRPEQLRSLGWMIEQENNPEGWVEQEMAEAVIPQLGWHAEARARRIAKVKGGVICDEVGYGKTAITVGLVSAQLGTVELPTDTDRIPTKASLTIVPAHLCRQWPSEIKKFTNGAIDPITILDMKDYKRLTVQDVLDADMIVVSESVFNSDLLWPALGDFSASDKGINKTDKNANRHFRTTVHDALEALPAQIAKLTSDDESGGAKAVHSAIKAARKTRKAARAKEEEGPGGRKQAAQRAREQLIESGAYKGADLKEKLAELKAAEARAEKAAISAKKTADKQEATLEDVWGLNSKDARKDWRQMKAPPLHMFAWQRLIVDEFAYLEGSALEAVKTLRASARWILSGTPPLGSFDQIMKIADLLHVHLGEVDNSPEVTVGNRVGASKKAQADRTAAEQFHSYKEVKTTQWFERRDRIAQQFLNQFARQNLAEIAEIDFLSELIKVQLPAAEMAIYRELEHHLFAIDQKLTKIAKISDDKKGDREVRLSEALGNSRSPEEALIKRCAHFSLDLKLEERLAQADAPGICDVILEIRQQQLESCIKELRAAHRAGASMHRWAIQKNMYQIASKNKSKKDAPTQHFVEWVESQFRETQNADDDTRKLVREALIEAGCTEKGVEKLASGQDPKGTKDKDERRLYDQHMLAWEDASWVMNKGKRTKLAPLNQATMGDKNWEIRSCVGKCRTLVKELVGRYRSQRYFAAVRDVQADLDKARKADLAISSACGHQGPRLEVVALTKLNKCVEPSCSAHLQSTNIVTADSLGVTAVSGNYGVKLETLVDLVEAVPKKDKILVFVQFDDLFDKVRDALHAYDIDTTYYTGGAKAMSKTLETFQNPANTKERILILNVADASAAGANLTVANHAFFISPLLTDTVPQYNAQMTQAIGRIRRYGQHKKVKVYHLLTADTQDVMQYVKMTKTNPDDVIAAFNAEHGARELKDPNAPKRERIREPLDIGPAKKGRKGAKKAAAPAPKAKGGKGKKQADSNDDEEDSAEDSGDDSDVVIEDAPIAPRAKSSRAAAVKATAKSKKAVSEEDGEDEVVIEATPKAAKAKVNKRVIESDTEDDDAEVAAALSPKKKAKASPSPPPKTKAKAKAAVTPAKAAPKSSPPKSTPASTSTWTPSLIKGSAKKVATPASDTKPKATPSKQGGLSSFFKRASGDNLDSASPAKKARVSVEPPALTASQRKAFDASGKKSDREEVGSPSATPTANGKVLVSALSGGAPDSAKDASRSVRFEGAEAEGEVEREVSPTPVVNEDNEIVVVEDVAPALEAALAAVAEDVEMAADAESPSSTLVASDAGDVEDALAAKIAEPIEVAEVEVVIEEAMEE